MRLALEPIGAVVRIRIGANRWRYGSEEAVTFSIEMTVLFESVLAGAMAVVFYVSLLCGSGVWHSLDIWQFNELQEYR